MKNLIFIAFLNFLFYFTGAQTSFEMKISDTSDQETFQILENDSEIVLVSTTGHLSLENHHAQLFRIDGSGLIINSSILKPEVYYYAILKLLKTQTGFIGFGYQQDSIGANATITLVELNDDFLIINEKQYLTNYIGIAYIEVVKKEHSLMVFYSGITQGYYFQLNAYKITYDLDTICSKLFSETGTKIAFDILTTENENIIKVFVRGFNQQTNTSSQILMIDSLLNIIEIEGIPEEVGNYIDVKYIDSQKYLLTGKKHIWNSNPQDDQLAIMLMDSLDNNLQLEMFGAPDTLDYPGIYSNLDFINTENIYYGGTKNFSINGIFAPVNTWFFLNKLNANLELAWQRFYGGDANYQLIDLVATQDGGCLMAGNFYNYTNQSYERDIYLLKVDEDGLVTATGEELPNITAQDAIVYPNPGNEYFNIQSGPQINGALFELFDMNGNLVLSTLLDERLENISTIKLSTGTYPYRITFQNKIVGSGKWVRE